MNKNILQMLTVLGANTDHVTKEKTFVENWKSITFNHYLYDKEWDIHGIDQFYERNRHLYVNNKRKFLSKFT